MAEPTPLPKLVVPRKEAAQRIEELIERGEEISRMEFRIEEDLDLAHSERRIWKDYSILSLKQLFDIPSLAEEFESYSGPISMHPSFSRKVTQFRESMDGHITRLDSILNRLELLPELEGKPTPIIYVDESPSIGNDIFIVHGKDDAAKESVSRFIEQLDLHPIILHEQPSAGRTIIEKFEDYSNVGFAVVLLTPDDIGAPHDKTEESKPRARQNVIFELGYFIGKLGRNKVCALYKEDVEIPSDFHGVVSIEMDTRDGWKLSLAKEIKQAGIDVDLNKVI